MRIKLLFLAQLVFWGFCSAGQVVFIKPITDLFPNKLSVYGKDFKQYYHNSIFSWESGKVAGLMRVGQVLFNEICDVVEHDKKTAEVLVEIGNFMAVKRDSSDLKACRFWTLQENVLFLDDTIDKNVLNCLVKPVTFDDPSSLYDSKYLTLTQPYKGFSVGTRFVRDVKNDSTGKFYAVMHLSEKNKPEQMLIPIASARVGSTELVKKDKRAEFIGVLKDLLGGNKCCVPYLWGGGSHGNFVQANDFELSSADFFGEDLRFWARKNVKEQPCSGYDCSSLVLRVAQAVGIPYFYKATTALFKKGQELAEDEKLAIGDLVVTQGHVFIVSDIEKNLLIEASGYGDGYGRVHEIALEKRVNVKNYQALLDRRKTKKPTITMLRKDRSLGQVREFKIMRLISDV